MKYENLKKEALKLRGNGFSLKEISDKLSISKSTASVWLRNVCMNQCGKDRLDKKVIQDRKRGIQIIKNQRILKDEDIKRKCKILLSGFKGDMVVNKIFCSLLYWCEGGKTESAVYFTNSDPELVKYFLKLLRGSFNVDENKFRICLHLHHYHNEAQQKMFWSKITNIPISKFFKIYKKSSSGKTHKDDYQGCISLRYYDYMVLKEIKYIIKYFIKSTGG